MQNPAVAALEAWAGRLPEALSTSMRIAVAYSGGADSTTLLHAATALWPGRVHALHVHHGLQPAADDFVRHCHERCAALVVPLQVGRVDARPRPGQSPEDAARRARYAALGGLAAEAGVRDVLLAQHADDQVETMLIALGRGAGLDGLAGMPERMERHGARFHRPLLGLPAAALRAWLVEAGVTHVEDPSNHDTAPTRNRIRRSVLPALALALPQFRQTFARSARNAARASALLAEVASEDLAAIGLPPRLDALRALPRERLANVLRHWLKQQHGAVPSEAQLGELIDQLAACRTRGHAIRLRVADGFVERERDTLRWYNPGPLP